MTGLAQAPLFLSSYAPLFLVFALLDTFGKGTPSVVCLALAGAGVISTGLLFLLSRRVAPARLDVTSVASRDGDVLAYVVTYLVPFASISAHTGRQQAAVGVFVGLIAVLYVRLNMFHVNPLLALLGYRSYSLDTAGGTSVVLITRDRFVRPGRTLIALRIDNYVWMEPR
jgi:hypothetical protein